MYYYRSDVPMTPFMLYISIIAIVLLLILLGLYRYMSMGVKPLKRLHQQIERFSQGEKDIDTRVEGSDEVAQVANAFHDSVEKVTALEQSRSLFMRNVMHELKTPITKGKLMSVLLDIDVKEQEELNELFEQMQTHLDDLAQVESLTAKSLELEVREYALVDIVEQVCDMLGINEDQCKSYIKNEKVNVDFNLFAYALKNLVDNGIKYTESLPIVVRYQEGCIEVINKGAPLTEDFNSYLKAFRRDRNYHSIEGMGLGLYIANEIIEKHGYTLQYTYKNEAHHFKVCL
jgi:two-component system OmpR family sensor kinase